MDVFEAIAEPNRRMILNLLAEGDRTVSDLVMAFPSLSQPAVSSHLRVLREAGLVQVRRQAQRRIYAIRPEGWTELDAWISNYRSFWEVQLDSLDEHLERRAPKDASQKKEEKQ
jgi:DNA-binding transcriptional ArsR family regulator